MKGAAMMVLGLFLMTPAVALAQGGYRDRQERREERREDRQERREERREDRQERREERREARRGYAWGNNNWGGSAQLRQTALNAGYNEGVVEGRRDRQRGERFNFTDESDYRNAARNYNSRLGTRALYQRYFRQGFENGYRDGWNGY
jgi:ATPase subunit of ABC transporter with duplicated ATPase domains